MKVLTLKDILFLLLRSWSAIHRENAVLVLNEMYRCAVWKSRCCIMRRVFSSRCNRVQWSNRKELPLLQESSHKKVPCVVICCYPKCDLWAASTTEAMNIQCAKAASREVVSIMRLSTLTGESCPVLEGSTMKATRNWWRWQCREINTKRKGKRFGNGVEQKEREINGNRMESGKRRVESWGNGRCKSKGTTCKLHGK